MSDDLISISEKQQEEQQEEQQDEPQKICRVCRDDDSEEPLFSPCHCKSSIHQQCLVNWLKSKSGAQDSSAIDYDATCEICLGKIHFKREYDTNAADIGFLQIMKVKVCAVLQCFKYTKYILVFINVIWVLVNWFVIRKYFVLKLRPRWEISYVFENNHFFVSDLSIAFQQCLFGASVLSVLLPNKMCRRLANHHLSKPIDTEIHFPKFHVTFKGNFFFFLATPLLVPLCLLVFGAIPIQLIKLVFRTRQFSNFSNHIFGSLVICLLISIVPVQAIPKSNECGFTVLFYTKYYAKLATIQYSQFLSFAVVVKPVIDNFFGNSLFGFEAHPMPVTNLSLKDLFMSPYSSFVFLMLTIMQFCNAIFFRPGAFYFLPKLGDETMTDDSLFLFSTFWHIWHVFKDILNVIAVFILLYGASLRLLVDFKPGFFPISLGFFLPKNQKNGGPTTDEKSNIIFSNLDKVLMILGPLLAKFSNFYFKPFAKATAKKLRLSSYLFGQNNIDERGYVAYRSWKHQIIHPTEAALSNSTLYSNPQTKTQLQNNFETNALVNAYFVPDGNFARVPNFLQMDETEKYFVPVTRKNKILGAEPDKLVSEYTQFRNTRNFSYDVVYVPPLMKLRLFVFYLVMGLICNMTFLYFTITSNYLGKYVLKLLQIAPEIHKYIDSRTPFTLTNVVIGLFLQLTLINSFSDKKIPKSTFANVGKAVKYPVMLYVFTQILTIVVFAFAGCISYDLMSAYELLYKGFMKGGKQAFEINRFYLVFPSYLFDEHMFKAFLPVLFFTAISFFKFVKLVANEDRSKVMLKHLWSIIVKPSLCLFTRYFGISLVLQAFYVLLKNIRVIKGFADMQVCMATMFLSQVHSWETFVFLLIGPAILLFEVTKDLWKMWSNYWAKSKLQTMDKLNADQIVLQDAE